MKANIEKVIINSLSRLLFLKPRTNNFLTYPCTHKGEVISETVLAPGLIVGRCLTKCDGRYAKITIMNLDPYEQVIDPKEFAEFLKPYTPPHPSKSETEDSLTTLLILNTGMSEHRKNYIFHELRTNDTWTDEQFAAISEVCIEFNDIFHLPNDILSHCNGTTHRIVTKEGTVPLSLRNHRLPPDHKIIINEISKFNRAKYSTT